jgi:hypothetical protein
MDPITIAFGIVFLGVIFTFGPLGGCALYRAGWWSESGRKGVRSWWRGSPADTAGSA